ncbi:RNA polymerase sigma factor [Actinoallomurus sp. CA-150999]|uniref:RNA polymerase sigma factor n=1 Tax=Actinoallomurus sp. CA-150999 TaxID=3239887 RepID=UPI003D94E19B
MTAAHPVREECDDAQLIVESHQDPEIFATLFDRYADDIHRYAARRVGTEHADDIVAETFLVAFRRRASYDTTRPMARPWLYGIATNLLARHRREEERLYRALQRTGVDPLPESMDNAVVARVAAQSHQRALAAALAGLKPRDRDTLLLLAWGGLTYEEVAEALDVPTGTVRSRIHRARKKTREALATTTDLIEGD